MDGRLLRERKSLDSQLRIKLVEMKPLINYKRPLQSKYQRIFASMDRVARVTLVAGNTRGLEILGPYGWTSKYRTRYAPIEFYLSQKLTGRPPCFALTLMQEPAEANELILFKKICLFNLLLYFRCEPW